MRAFTCGLALSLSCHITSSLAIAQPSFAPVPSETARASQVAATAPRVDYPGAIWVPAAPGNFRPANRPEGQPIEMVVVHDIEGPDTRAISIFQRVGAKVSSHYVVGVDGIIYQMVRERDIAWHAGNSDINGRAIGIETQGYAYRPGFYSAKVLEAEARLVRDITRRFNIPRDRAHIIGHAEVPNPRDPTRFGGLNGHTDPGPYWDWNTFMALVRNDARLENAGIPSVIRPGEILPVVVSLRNSGDDVWAANKARDPHEGLVADAPLIFLGTSEGTSSALSTSNGWIAPQYADALKTADVVPGASARFEFSIQGPRTPGEINETLRAIRVPTQAQGGIPVAFGDFIPLKLSVVPWDIPVPAPDAPSSPNTNFNPLVAPPIARWTVKLPIGGIWGVFIAPPKPAKVRKKESFSYSIGTAPETRDVAIASKNAGKGLVFGGYHRFPEPTANTPAITVTLDKAPEGISATSAGSLRFVGPFADKTTSVSAATASALQAPRQ